MTAEPRTRRDYGDREIEAARRVLVDLGQVLGSYFADSIVVVGGLVPVLLLSDSEEPHVGSIDIDLALDPDSLREGRYAEIVKLLRATRRYEKTNRQFRMRSRVDLGDGGQPVVVDVDFLKPRGKRGRRRGPSLVPGFRPLDADGCSAAFLHPERVKIAGSSIAGVRNRVFVRVAAIQDLLLMKAYALANRDKPKDAYDICYCLDHQPDGIESLAHAWRARREDRLVVGAIEHLREKFEAVDSYGPQQVAIFYDAVSADERDMRARRAYELVNHFLALIEESED